MTYDIKISGGEIVDGSGRPRRKGDVAISDGKVVALGEAPGDARETIDATGHIVSPGFVDIHTHYDAQVLWDPMLTISPWHGVTSVVVGNCGFGVAPTKPEHRELILRTRMRANVLNFEEAEVREILQDPNVLIALGDGGAHMSQLCDACYATHLLGHWVRDDGALTLEQAVHQLTQRPADIFGLKDRGRLAVGLPADVVVFDPARVGASKLERVYDLPAGEDRLISRPQGVKAVIVNGVTLPEPGVVPKAPSGRLLRQRA